ncbi:MAG: Stk1 family PASTA domain-containing Ser/Thr kinase [Oscillospiraceae bacterium]|nr:Stk1 family PASTA domain-containing Ser/Thr kinase [Oscillospiraceae bacterium]
MDQYIGKMLDNRYELLEVIGSGGMAVVYKAKCHRLNRMVAVKILRQELVEDAEFRRRFRDESQAVAMLSHPNIVSVYDVSRSGETEYIVMELIDGITLKQYMEKRGQLNWKKETLHFIIQIMRGLSHAHSRGIVHRDIKPHNIMVLRDGSVKITDFGIACLATATTTLTAEALGSVHYISPEQARGERVTARSDIYSAGVLLYELLTGRLPFEGESAVAVALQHLSSIPLSPREVNPEIPETLELICMKAMTADASRRYQSADEMISALEEFRKNPEVKLDIIVDGINNAATNEPTSKLPVDDVGKIYRPKQPPVSVVPDDPDDDDGMSHYEAPRRKKNGLIIAGLAILALVLLVGIGKVLSSSFADSGDDGLADVPNLLGKTMVQAESMEEINGIFTIEVIGSRESTEYAVGEIIEQDPGVGARKAPGTVIKVFVSQGDGSKEMPNLIGEDSQAALVMLSNLNLGLTVERDTMYHDTIEAGKVISTIPDAGESLSKDNTVLLMISMGKEPVPVTVISFLGQTKEEAEKNATDLGLVVKGFSYAESHEEVGTVIEQSLAPYEDAMTGTEITFVISSGPPATSVTKRYPLPFWQNEEVHVRIEFDGEEVYNELVSTMLGYVEQTYTGKGSGHRAKVYYNDALTYDEEINFK